MSLPTPDPRSPTPDSRPPTPDLQLHLETFDGPLELLLTLIEQRRLPITEVRLAPVRSRTRSQPGGAAGRGPGQRRRTPGVDPGCPARIRPAHLSRRGRPDGRRGGGHVPGTA